MGRDREVRDGTGREREKKMGRERPCIALFSVQMLFVRFSAADGQKWLQRVDVMSPQRWPVKRFIDPFNTIASLFRITYECHSPHRSSCRWHDAVKASREAS